MARRTTRRKTSRPKRRPWTKADRHCAQKTLAKENRRRSDFTVHEAIPGINSTKSALTQHVDRLSSLLPARRSRKLAAE
jgi:hypothetical protein